MPVTAEATGSADGDEPVGSGSSASGKGRILPVWMSWRRWSLSHRRLRGELVAFRGEMYARTGGGPSSSSRQVQELTQVAAEHAESGDVSVGFEALNAARRVALEVFSADELRAEAIALRAEATKGGKFSAWRSDGIEQMLVPFAGDDPIDDTQARVLLRKALRLRDDGAQNTHRKLDLVARRYWQLLTVTVAAVVILVLLSWRSPLDLSPDGDDAVAVSSSPLAEWTVWLYAFLLGVIGACVSAGLSLSKQTHQGRVPEVRGQTIPAVFRPVFGGAAAIGSLTILAAGLLAGLTVSTGTVLCVAFLAGFSERLIDKASAKVGPGD